MYQYVLARSGKSNRPTCQHILDLSKSWANSEEVTLCGFEMSMVSRQYQPGPIEVILCKRCEKINEVND